ncbi:MAG: hypothetical protein WCC38_01040 [Pseudonocardiaceae bacterium]
MGDEVGVDGQQPRRAEAMRNLPGAYSLALRLRAAGVTDELIAECLAVEREALDPLLDVAEAKLAAILVVEQGNDQPDGRGDQAH